MHARRLFTFGIAFAALSGCAGLLGPADPIVYAAGKISPDAEAPCFLKAIQTNIRQTIHYGPVEGTFEIAFSYRGSYRDVTVDFELACKSKPWVTVAQAVRLPSPYSSRKILLGTISPVRESESKSH